MTSYLTFYDSAWPPPVPPSCDGVCGYIGGDTPHVWTAADWASQKARYRLPIFVRSNPRGIAGVPADVNAALTQLRAIGAPRGTLVCWDMETAADALYIAGVYAGLAGDGYRLIVYGSQADVMGNAVPDGLYFGADWSGVAHMAGGDVMTQWVSFAAYDESLALATLPFWDTRPAPLQPPAPGPVPTPSPAVPAWQEALMNQLPIVATAEDIAAHNLKGAVSQDEAGQVWFVHRVQNDAKGLGTGGWLSLGEITDIAVDGVYGPKSKAAVQAVQKYYGITQDGIVGNVTWSVLLTGAP